MDRALHSLKSYRMLIFFVLLTIGLGAASNWYLFQDQLPGATIRAAWEKITNPTFLVVVPLFTLANIGLRYLKWIFLLRTFRLVFPARTIFLYYLISFIGNLTPFYFLYLLRIIPLYEHRKNGLFVLALDMGLDFLAVLAIANHPEWGIFAALGFAITIVASSLLRGTHSSPTSVRVLSVSSMLLFSTAIWAMTGLGLKALALALGHNVDAGASARILASANLKAVLSFIPAGIYVNGAAMIDGLQAAGFDHATAMVCTALHRGMTLWLAVGMGLATLFLFRRNLRSELHRENHFNLIADEYAEQIPEHVRDRMLGRKMSINERWLPRPQFSVGLDAGCGQGWYLARMVAAGYDMSGIDFSSGQVEKARINNPTLPASRIQPGSIAAIPFPDRSFDFAYTINVLHHLPDRETQMRAYREFFRVLKPGGRLIIHEINVLNPLFRLYMSYIFPLINSIDEGTEIWILERDAELKRVFRVDGREFFTFLPEFLPELLLTFFQPIERILERLPFTRRYSAHYALVLHKPV